MAKFSLFYFILGRNPKLSILEIISYLNSLKIDFSIEDLIEDCIIFEIESKFRANQAAEIISGTIKIGKIHIISTWDNIRDKIESNNFYLEDDKKISYSINKFGKKIERQYYVDVFKKIFKDFKQKALLKNYPPHSLSKALKSSSFIDIDIISKDGTGNKIYVGRGISGHDISDNKKRYERRPHVDEEIGTSIRIARILINLASLKSGDTILDPFCGIGTILQESLILGLNVVGTELESKRVNLCINNLDWLTHQYKIPGTFEVMQCDARDVAEKLRDKRFDAIITEPELGPFLKSVPTYSAAREYIGNLTSIYKPFLLNISNLLKDEGKLVIVLPRYSTGKGKSQGIDIDRIINRTNLRLYNPISFIKSKIDLKIDIPFIYKEKWHKLERLIYIFEKKVD